MGYGYDFAHATPQPFMIWGPPTAERPRNFQRGRSRPPRTNRFFDQCNSCHCQQHSRDDGAAYRGQSMPRWQRDAKSGRRYWEIPIQRVTEETPSTGATERVARRDEASKQTEPETKSSRRREIETNTVTEEFSHDQEVVGSSADSLTSDETRNDLHRNESTDESHGTPQEKRLGKEPQTTLDPKAAKLKRIKNIEDTVEELAIKASAVITRDSKDYRYIEEMFTKCLLKLDEIPTDGDEDVRMCRRKLAQQINGELGSLDERCLDNSNGVLGDTELESTSISIGDLFEACHSSTDMDVNETGKEHTQDDKVPEELSYSLAEASQVTLHACEEKPAASLLE